MVVEIYQIPVLLCLAYGSFQDLKKFSVKDKVWVAGLLPSIGLAALTQPDTFFLQMVVQGFVMLLFGIGIRLATRFGGADILALATAGSLFPYVLSFKVAGIIAIPMLLWMKLYFFLTQSREVPAVPGIFLGTVLAVLVL